MVSVQTREALLTLEATFRGSKRLAQSLEVLRTLALHRRSQIVGAGPKELKEASASCEVLKLQSPDPRYSRAGAGTKALDAADPVPKALEGRCRS